jgi:hypothetical protein
MLASSNPSWIRATYAGVMVIVVVVVLIIFQTYRGLETG